MRLTKLLLLPLSLAWKLYANTGRFEGVCPRCGARISVPRGRTGMGTFFGMPPYTWCDVCNQLGDSMRVPVKRTAWLF